MFTVNVACSLWGPAIIISKPLILNGNAKGVQVMRGDSGVYRLVEVLQDLGPVDGNI
jgi:hypothetical protein